jgi:hypothetical protein
MIKIKKWSWANSSQDLISKTTRAKWTRELAQAVELLSCKHEALSSNPSPIPPKIKKWAVFLPYIVCRIKGKCWDHIFIYKPYLWKLLCHSIVRL